MNINKKKYMYAAISMASNLLIPLAAIPFLLNALGQDSFGQLAIAQASTLILCQIIDFGFSLGAAREVATKNTSEEISRVYSYYQNARLVLLALALSIAPILIFSNIITAPAILIAVTFFPFAVGIFFQSNWFFHGRAEYGWLAFANTAGKLVYFFIAFIFIHSKSDLFIAGLSFGVGQLVSGIILQFALIRMKIKFTVYIKFSEFLNAITTGAANFSAIAILSIHTQFVIVLTGFFVSAKAAGEISVIDKVVRGVAAFLFPSANIYFAKLSKLYDSDVNTANYLHKKLGGVILWFSIASSVAIFFLGEKILTSIVKIENEHLSELIYVASPMPFFIGIGLVYGGLKLIPMGFNGAYLISISIGEFLGLIAFFVSLGMFNDIAGMISISVAEFVIGICMYLSVKFSVRK